MSLQPLNLMVFREGRRDVSVCNLKNHLIDQSRRLPNQPQPDDVLAALLLAGELECGVVDALAVLAPAFDPPVLDCPALDPPALNLPAPNLEDYPKDMLAELEGVTDTLARVLVRGNLAGTNLAGTKPAGTKPAGIKPAGIKPEISGLAETLEAFPARGQISVSAPEGLAYYALHPLAYADAVKRLTRLGNAVAVVGIRSIGTTLSAVVAAAVRQQGINASRITVRPHGHPYNRELRFSDAELQFVDRALVSGADFLIVDEGPGLSGSSFLAVAEALVRAGVPREKITLLCGHQPNFDSLRAHNAADRAGQFRWLAVDRAHLLPTPFLPKDAGVFLGGGEWRRLFFPDESVWPAAWTSFERLKYLPADNGSDARFYKFLGLGHYGEAVFAREQRVAEAGFGPQPQREKNGFASYPWIKGRPMCAAQAATADAATAHLNDPDWNENVLAAMAEYCAFRAAAFPAALHDLASLQNMAGHNLRELGLSFPVQLELKRPVIADGRMQPHEWLLTADGLMLKTDSGSHGDDHFFPGPTDIAWDLAGAIVEWEMSAEQSSTFLELYRRTSGEDATSRIEHFVRAYSVFRAAYCLMAANALGEGRESQRFRLAAEKYKLFVSNPRAQRGIPASRFSGSLLPARLLVF
jgi:hypothetical protein